MKKHLAVGVPALLSIASAFAEVTLTFNTDAEGFAAGGNAISVEWEALHGGSLAVTFGPTGWLPDGARLDLTALEDEAWQEELQQVLANGGTLSFRLLVRSEDLIGDYPGWFEPILALSGGDVVCCGDARPVMPALNGRAESFPPGETQTFEVSVVIAPFATAEADPVLQINPDAGSHIIQFGLNSEANTYTSAKYYIDNFTLAAYEEPLVIVPPEVTVEPATAGLNVIASPLGEWARQGVRTMSPEYSWVDASSPVTYSLTIGEHSEQLRHEIYLYFVPNGALPATATAPDWSETVCAVVNIDRHGDGTTPGGWMRFAYKNDPENGSASNGRPGHEYWDVNDGSNSDGGQVAFATSTTMTGTWSVTIANNTEVTVTTPDGSTASGVLHPDAAALFAGDLYVYCGAHPGGIVGNVGRAIIFDAFAITGGVANPLTVDLAGEIFDPAVLERAADGPAGIVQVVRGDTPFWLKWSLPAPGFLLYQSTTLKAGEWEELALDDAFTRGGTERWKPLSLSGGLFNAATGYFQLARPE